MDSSQKIQLPNFLNLAQLRNVLCRTAHEISNSDFSLQVICPFGFEFTEDPKYLQRNLKRFYFYVGSPKYFDSPSDALVEKFFDAFLRNIRSVDPDFANTIIAFIIERDSHYKRLLKPDSYLPLSTDKVVTIEHRIITSDLLTDYADFLISTLFAFAKRTLPQLQRFDHSENIRRRVFQLYVTLECIFGKFAIQMNSSELQVYTQITSLNTAKLDHYFVNMDTSPPTILEKSIYNTILNRLDIIHKKVASYDRGKINVSVKSYNASEIFNFEINSTIYQESINLIKQMYSRYCLTQVSQR